MNRKYWAWVFEHQPSIGSGCRKEAFRRLCSLIQSHQNAACGLIRQGSSVRHKKQHDTANEPPFMPPPPPWDAAFKAFQLPSLLPTLAFLNVCGGARHVQKSKKEFAVCDRLLNYIILITLKTRYRYRYRADYYGYPKQTTSSLRSVRS